MRGVAFAAVAVLLTTLISGCTVQKDDLEAGVDGLTSGSGSGSKTGTSSASKTGTSGTSGTGTPTGTNHAPVANLTASTLSGAAPMTVNFTLNGTDAEGDALSWTLTYGNASANVTGTVLPANATHVFDAAGTFNVTLVISDGKLSANATVTIVVSAAAAAATGFTPIDATKSWTVSFGGAFEYGLGCYEDGVDCAYFDLGNQAVGRAFTMTFSSTVPSGLYWIDYYKGGDYIDTFIGEPGATSIADNVPAGTNQFRAYATGGAMNTAHLVIL
jgi:PKD repeat protein